MDVSPPRPRDIQATVRECDRALAIIASKLVDPKLRQPQETEALLHDLANQWLDLRNNATIIAAAKRLGP